jgi:hypothetical protein
MLFDRTCRGDWLTPGLSHAWSVGGRLYQRLGRIDAWYGAATWAEGLDWLGSHDREISEIQYWGHGTWGGLWMDEELLRADALDEAHRHHARLAAIKQRMTPASLWWFRSCDVFGTGRGQQFARAWTAFFNCRAAGHTYEIGVLQSGLHVLAPGEEPTWPTDEGVKPGVAHARSSSVFAPNTITFLHGTTRRSDQNGKSTRRR